jgi:hypothetical protein
VPAGPVDLKGEIYAFSEPPGSGRAGTSEGQTGGSRSATAGKSRLAFGHPVSVSYNRTLDRAGLAPMATAIRKNARHFFQVGRRHNLIRRCARQNCYDCCCACLIERYL